MLHKGYLHDPLSDQVPETLHVILNTLYFYGDIWLVPRFVEVLQIDYADKIVQNCELTEGLLHIPACISR